MNRRFSSRRPQKGYALAELILTLGIGTIIAASVWGVYAERRVANRATKHADAIQSLFHQSDKVYALSIEFVTVDGSGTEVPLSLDRLAAATSADIPVEVQPSASGYVNYWGGTWNVGTASTNGGSVLDLVTVETTNIPQDECIIILQQVSPFVYDTYVNGNLVGLERTEGNTVARNSLNFTQALPLCQDSNTMRFRKLKELNLSALRKTQPFSGSLTPQERGDVAGDRHYQQAYLPNYNRVRDALAARETAQQALDP